MVVSFGPGGSADLLHLVEETVDLFGGVFGEDGSPEDGLGSRSALHDEHISILGGRRLGDAGILGEEISVGEIQKGQGGGGFHEEFPPAGDPVALAVSVFGMSHCLVSLTDR